MLKEYIDKVQINNKSLKDQIASQETIITQLSNDLEQVSSETSTRLGKIY